MSKIAQYNQDDSSDQNFEDQYIDPDQKAY